MDKKNNNKADLLAAGRKKLQQFRQKKDGKGGKSSGKPSKSGRDGGSDAAATATSEKVLDKEVSVPDTGDVVTNSELHIADHSSKDDIRETNRVTIDEKSGLKDSGRGNKHDHGLKFLVPFEGGGASDVRKDVEVGDSGASDIVITKEKLTPSDMPVPVDLSSQGDRCREEQEDGSSGPKKTDGSSEIRIERLVSDVGIMVDGKEVTNEAVQITQSDDVSSTAMIVNVEETQERGVHTVFSQPSPESEQFFVASTELQGDKINDLFDSSSEGAQADSRDKKDDAEGSFVYEDGIAKSLGSNMLKLPFGPNPCSIRLSQLAEVIKGLDKDEFGYLFCSRESHSPLEKLMNSVCLDAPEFNFLERLKEQLYLTSFAKDASQLQISEQLELEMQLRKQFQKLVVEMSVTTSSLSEVQGKSEILSKELAECRSELQEFSSGREELQKQLHSSKAEVEEFSVKVDHLQNKLEMSGGELASLATELADCRNSVAALQTENQNLNGRLTLMMEEKMGLVEDKEYRSQETDKMAAELAHCKALSASLESENVNLTEYLASVKEENRKFDEEKDHLVGENGKLFSDLADCNVMVEALQAERTNLSGLLTVAQEEMKKLEEARANFVHENEKLALDLVNTRSLLDACQLEISNLNGSLVSLMEVRNKLDDEKQHLLSENQRGLCELADCKVVIAGLQEDFSKAMGDLKEASSHIEQLTQENVLLRTNLELHIAQISSSQNTVDQFEDSDRPNLVNVDNSSPIPGTEVSDTAISASGGTSSKNTADGPHPRQLVLDDSNYSPGFEFWKMHLKEANEVLQKLEIAVDGMQSLSASSSRSSGTAPVVSKLIQAFETRSHTDDNEIAELHPSENSNPVDPYMQAKEQTKNLQMVLKEMLLQAENACIFLEGERKSRLSTEVLNAELKACCEFWESHSNNLEEENIELVVLCETLKQHICSSKAGIRQLVASYNDLQKQEVTLDSENSQLKVKLSSFQDKVTEFQSHLDEICRSSDQMVSSISSKVETFHKEIGDMGSILEEEWKTFVTQIILEVGKLDMSIETLCSITLLTDKESILHVGSGLSASIDVATKVIECLQGRLQVTLSDHRSVLNNYTELNKEFNKLQENNEVLVDILEKIYRRIRTVVESCGHAVENVSGLENEKLVDPLDPGAFNLLLEKLQNSLDEKLQLLSDNDRLNSAMVDQVREIDELKRRCFHLDAILKLFENVGEEFMLDSANIDPIDPVSSVEFFITNLIQKYKETMEKVCLSKENPAVNEIQFGDFHGELDHLSFLLVQYENENLVLKESWRTINMNIPAFRAELREKVAELDQSEQRVLSLREKLSIAVSKGKGLIVQRDGLKQSLAETSNQLEKCSQELHLKDARIYELEAKLQNYSEAGERMEALKSELAYIRNSATALRESFLLKDSVLQRIEEILEDLELPEHFHSRDIIEKVDWLAKSISRNALSVADWDQKSSAGGGSYPEGGFTGMDAWKEETQPNQDSADDYRRRYEELQGKFYGLAEHNEMLEQSLMERNNLVQRWEETIGKIEIPSQLRSLEPEDKIQWLGVTLSDAQNQCHSLQQRIDYLDTLRGSLTGELEESEIRISELESAHHSVIVEKEFLLKNLETVTTDYDEFSKKASLLEIENENLLKEIASLQEQLDQKLVDEEHVHHIEGQVRRLQNLIHEVLQDSVIEGPEFATDNVENLEHLLIKLVEKYRTLSMGERVNSDATDMHLNENANLTHVEKKIRDSGDTEEDVVDVTKRLEDTLGELMCLKEERDRDSKKNESLVWEIEALEAKKAELQELLNHEEQKSAALREKLNMAVKKGKSLVQQRDNLKQVIDEANAEVDRLKSEITHRESSIADYEHRFLNLSISQERIEVVEAECAILRDRLSGTECCLEEKEHMLRLIIEYFKDFEVHFDCSSGSPVEKLEAFGKYCKELRLALDSSEQESRKSKRAAELLLAELNEVQERNDALQEDLAKVATDLSELSREKEISEAAKSEALAHLEKLSAARVEERDHLFSEISMLRSGVDQLRVDISSIDSSLADVLSKDLEILHNLDASIKSCLEPTNSTSVAAMPAVGAIARIIFPKLENKIFMTEVGSLKERLQRHYHSLHEEASHVFDLVRALYTEVVSLKESFGSKDRELMQMKSIMNEKDSELVVMRRNILLLFEACNISIAEIESWRTRQNGIGNEAPYNNLKSQTIVGKNTSTEEAHQYSEENIMAAREKLLLVVKDLITMQNVILEDSRKEMKTLILNLQKELDEKDTQRDRICTELVSQIKEAEVKAMTYMQDLQSTKTQANDLQDRVSVMEEERAILEDRVKKSEDREAMCVNLQQRVKSLTDALAAKDQEIEALMQALDEEESQMEDLSNKILELGKDLQKKNQDLENLEASRGKALKKLSVTVSKFDELHHLSETLLSEVEKLQSQLQERDGEISFLRQEVTRCTNETLSATQMSKIKNSEEVLEILTLLDTVAPRVEVNDMYFSDAETNQVGDHKVKLQEKISFILSELEELRTVARDRDSLLGVERSRVEELTRKEQLLENSLLEKESQLTMLRRLADSRQATSSSSEIVEVDPLINKRAAPGSIAPQVRGGRKMNSDHVAIAIDMDHSSPVEDDDDDKAHGFKSLTTSTIVPRFTRPVSDMIDGLWMSCDRTLMRQPTLRLGVIIYWAIIHTLLAAFVV